MTFARASRWLLAFAALLIVLWSFLDVAVRALAPRAATAHKTTLTILHWGSKDEVPIVQALVERYEHDHPDIHIERIHAGDYEAKLKTMFAAGTPPDLFYLGYEALPEMAGLNLLAPIDSYLQEERKTGRAQWLDDFYPVLLDTFRYDGKQVGRGPLYGLPKDFTTAVMYVNLDLFERAGARVPYDGWTWDEFEADMAKIAALSTPDHKIYGGVIESWPAILRNIVWTFGGDYFGNDFRDVRLSDPPTQRALEMIRRLRIENQTVFNATGIAKEGGQEFFTGNIGCHGPIGRWRTPVYRNITNFRWDVVPVPHATTKASALFTVAWTMSAATKHPREAFDLMKFLSGPEGQAINARLGLAIPALKSVANSDAFLAPGLAPAHSQLFLDAIPLGRVAQTPEEQEWTRIVQDETNEAIQLDHATPMQAAETIKQRWLAELDSPLQRSDFPLMRWDIIGLFAAVVLIMTALLLWRRAAREKLGPIDRSTERAGFLFISPWIIGFLALTLGPMVISLLLSFTKWTAMTPFNRAQFVGAANYRELLVTDTTFALSLKLTFYFVLLAVPLHQLASLAVALLMNTKVRGITIFRTIYFVPSVVTGVALATLWLWMFNKEYGLLNAILKPLASALGTTPPDWFGNDASRWAIPAFVLMGLWGVGGGMVIYLAGLKGIPASLYEAATIDGAGPMRKFWNVTLPMLSPLLFYNLVMGIIGSFQVFTQAKVMTNGGPANKTLFYVLNLYQNAFEFHHMGYASAMAWVLFLLVLVLTILVFRGSKNLVYYEGLKT